MNQPLQIVVTANTSSVSPALKTVQTELAATALSAQKADSSLAAFGNELSSQGALHDQSSAKISKTALAFEHLTSADDIAAHSIRGFGRELLHILPSLAFGGVVELGALALEFLSKALDSAGESSGTAAANLQNLNDVFKDADKDAGKQVADLKILYDAATSVTVSTKDRLAAVKELQKEFPDYFGNLKTETILNGGARVQYDDLTASIIKTAQATAAKSKIDALAAQQLDNAYQKQKIINATNAEAARAQDRILSSGTSGSSFTGGGSGGDQVTITKQEQIKVIEARRDAALKLVDINDKSLQDQIKFLTNFAGLPSLAKVIEDQDDPGKTAVKHIETIAEVLAKLGIQIDFLNQKALILKTDEAQAKIAAIEGTIDHLLQKFKLTSSSPIILTLEAEINDIQLQEEFKKVFKVNTKEKIDIPIDVQIDMQKPEVKFPPGTFDEDILREEILKKLKELGIDKTIPIKIGTDASGGDITAGSESVSQSTPLPKLTATLAEARKKITDFQKQAASDFKNFGVDIATEIGESIGNALGGGKDPLKGLFDSIFTSVGTQLEALGKLLIQSGIEIKFAKDAFKKLLADPLASIAVGIGLVALGALLKSAVGKSVPGFAGGVTNFGGGLALVGEQGPELVSLPRGSSVIPNNQIGGYSGTQVFIPAVTIRGSDLLLTFNRAQQTASRNG